MENKIINTPKKSIDAQSYFDVDDSEIEEAMFIADMYSIMFDEKEDEYHENY